MVRQSEAGLSRVRQGKARNRKENMKKSTVKSINEAMDTAGRVLKEISKPSLEELLDSFNTPYMEWTPIQWQISDLTQLLSEAVALCDIASPWRNSQEWFLRLARIKREAEALQSPVHLEYTSPRLPSLFMSIGHRAEK